MYGKAPSGGLVSEVNGQFYEGGQFTPDTGLYCGRGKNRVSVAQLAAINAALAEKRPGWFVRYREEYRQYQVVNDRGNGMASAANIKTLASYWQ